MSSISNVLFISCVLPFFSSLLWPGSVVEQCSRHREKDAQCLSLSIDLRTSSASLRVACVGEPRRGPEGPQYGQHGFDYFGRNQSSSAAGPIPGSTEKLIDAMILKPGPHVLRHECFLLSKPTLYLGCSSPSGKNNIIED